jgi:hypothetical protein
LFYACFRYPVLGRSCPYASRHTASAYYVKRAESKNELDCSWALVFVYYIVFQNITVYRILIMKEN